jgi:hypothetical protein
MVGIHPGIPVAGEVLAAGSYAARLHSPDERKRLGRDGLRGGSEGPSRDNRVPRIAVDIENRRKVQIHAE